MMTGSRSPIHYVPYDDVFGRNFEDMSRSVPDIGKIRQLVGFRPRSARRDARTNHRALERRSFRPSPKGSWLTEAQPPRRSSFLTDLFEPAYNLSRTGVLTSALLISSNNSGRRCTPEGGCFGEVFG